MNAKPRFLKSDALSIEKLTSLSSETWLKAKYGDPQRFPSVAGRLNELISLTKANTAKVMALGNDETRMAADLHHTGKTIAESTSQAIRTVSGEIKAAGESLMEDGYRIVEDNFRPREGYQTLESEQRAWVRERVKTPEGLGEVSKMVKEDSNFASLISYSPAYLLGIAKTVHERWRIDGINAHLPSAAKKLEDGADLVALSAKYEKVVADVHSSYYDAAIADKMKTRVEV